MKFRKHIKSIVMKKALLIISVIAITAGMVACNNQPKSEMTKAISYEDTVGLASFQNWKAQNERADIQAYLNNANQNASATPVRKTSTSKPATKTVYRTTTTQPVAQTQKKGWSKAAKGAAIGAGSGAVIGAVINKKNRVLGGVIGGVLGGGVGYGIGRGMDKKDGRY